MQCFHNSTSCHVFFSFVYGQFGFQMKDEDKEVILKAMSFMVTNLDVDDKFISEFETCDAQSSEEIMVHHKLWKSKM